LGAWLAEDGNSHIAVEEGNFGKIGEKEEGVQEERLLAVQGQEIDGEIGKDQIRVGFREVVRIGKDSSLAFY